MKHNYLFFNILKFKHTLSIKNYEEQYIHTILEYVFDLAKIADNASALYFLEQASVLPSQKLQREHLKELLVTNKYTIEDLSAGLNDLVETGWIALTDEQELIYTYHPVIQEIVREKVMPNTDNMIRVILNKLGYGLEKDFININIWIEYGKSILLYGDENNISTIQLLNSVALAYEKKGEYHEAIKCAERTIRVLPAESPNLFSPLNIIGTSYLYLSEPKKAKDYYQKALEICNKYNNIVPSSAIIASYSNLGNLALREGYYRKSIEYGENALSILEKLPKSEFLFHKATVYNNIAIAYRHLDKHNEAISFNLEVIKIRETILPPNHPYLATSYSNISINYLNIKQVDIALEYALKALDIYQQIKHPLIAIAYLNLGCIYDAKKDFHKSLEAAFEALKILDVDSFDSHKALVNVSHAYFQLKRYDDALKYVMLAIEVSIKKLGFSHPEAKDVITSGKIYLEDAITEEGKEKYIEYIQWFQQNLNYDVEQDLNDKVILKKPNYLGCLILMGMLMVLFWGIYKLIF